MPLQQIMRNGRVSYSGIWEVPNFRKGKKTRHGKPVRIEPQLVTVVTRDRVERFLGARGKRLRDHLRKLREDGVLVHGKNSLQQPVRIDDPTARDGVRRERCYVFRGPSDEVPRARTRAPVITF